MTIAVDLSRGTSVVFGNLNFPISVTTNTLGPGGANPVVGGELGSPQYFPFNQGMGVAFGGDSTDTLPGGSGLDIQRPITPAGLQGMGAQFLFGMPPIVNPSETIAPDPLAGMDTNEII